MLHCTHEELQMQDQIAKDKTCTYGLNKHASTLTSNEELKDGTFEFLASLSYESKSTVTVKSIENHPFDLVHHTAMEIMTMVLKVEHKSIFISSFQKIAKCYQNQCDNMKTMIVFISFQCCLCDMTSII